LHPQTSLSKASAPGVSLCWCPQPQARRSYQSKSAVDRPSRTRPSDTIALDRDTQRARRSPGKNDEHRRNQHRAAHRAGFREFSSRNERQKGSRRSLNKVARRAGGIDCLRSLRSAYFWAGRRVRGVGLRGTPRPVPRRSMRLGDRHAAWATSTVTRLDRHHITQLKKNHLLAALPADEVEIDVNVVGKWRTA